MKCQGRCRFRGVSRDDSELDDGESFIAPANCFSNRDQSPGYLSSHRILERAKARRLSRHESDEQLVKGTKPWNAAFHPL